MRRRRWNRVVNRNKAVRIGNRDIAIRKSIMFRIFIRIVVLTMI